jgi:Flp pilus assembly pilin Flp
MGRVLLRLYRDTRGQDLIEYALLTTFIGFAGLLVVDVILSAIGVTYTSQENAIDSVWIPNAPGSAGS